MELSEQEKEHIAKIQQMKQDYTDVFSGEKGQRVLDDLQRKCFKFRTTFSKDEYETARNEGMRSVLLHIENMQRIDVEATKQLMEKSKEGEKDV